MRLLECPGVAVDGNDRVFILTRGEHPIMVFDKDGNFERSFGQAISAKTAPTACTTARRTTRCWPLTMASTPSRSSASPAKS